MSWMVSYTLPKVTASGAVEHLLKEHGKLRRALEWYANEENWKRDDIVKDDPTNAEIDRGEIARTVLRGIDDDK